MTGEPHCAVGVPNVGPFGDPLLLVELAVAAEEHGWDGFFVWDHLLYHDQRWDVADPATVIAAVAARTARIRIGVLVNVLARRRIGEVAREPVTMRGEYLTAADVRMLPRPVQRPRIPIWCGGRWPGKAPFRRAARWDGVMPTHAGYGLGETMPPGELRAVVQYTRQHRTGDGPFDVILEGRTDGAAPGGGAGQVVPYLEAGLTWWVEALGWWRGGPQDAMNRVRQGPPALTRQQP